MRPAREAVSNDKDGPVVDGLGRDRRRDVDGDGPPVRHAQVLAGVVDLVVVELEERTGDRGEVPTAVAPTSCT